MKSDIKNLDTIFQYVIHNEYSDFYRKLYTLDLDKIDSLEDWRQLPFLTKDALNDCKVTDRIFTKLADVDVYRNTSGTSGKQILIVPRTRTIDYGRIYSGLNPTGFLIFHQPIHLMLASVREHFPDIPVLAGDPANIPMSITLAKQADVDSMVIFAFLLDVAIPFLEQEKMCESLRYLHIIGERVTDAQYHRLKEQFPNAWICNDYGSTELQGTPLVAMHNDIPEERYVMEQWDDYYLELIDLETDEVLEKNDIEGELVVTTLWTEKNTSPFLRYRTGDIAKRVESKTIASGFGYVVLGRKDIDRVKIAGGEIKVEEIERVLKTCAPEVTDFELHVHREVINGTEKHRLELKAVATAEEVVKLKNEFANLLRISPTFTYQKGFEQNIFGPCVVVAVDSLASDAKRKRLIVHQ